MQRTNLLNNLSSNSNNNTAINTIINISKISESHTGQNDEKKHVVSERDETMLTKLVEDTVWWQLTVIWWQLIFLQHHGKM